MSPRAVLVENEPVEMVLGVPLAVPLVVTCSIRVGVPVGVIELVATEELLLPAEFAALTLKVYGVPAVRPLMVQEVPAVLHV
jgi:uncharacterized protein (DUF2062 family)